MCAIRFVILFTAILSIAVLPAPAAAQMHKIANIDSGAIEGNRSGGVLSFKGVPYAAPPIDSYRWRAPQPVTALDGRARKRSTFGHDCMQKPELGDPAQSRTTPAEDCLVLNVWRPAATAWAKSFQS